MVERGYNARLYDICCVPFLILGREAVITAYTATHKAFFTLVPNRLAGAYCPLRRQLSRLLI